MIHLRAGRVPGNDLAVGAGFPVGAHQARLQVNEIVADSPPLMILAAIVIQAKGNSAIDVDEGIALGQGVRGVVPH